MERDEPLDHLLDDGLGPVDQLLHGDGLDSSREWCRNRQKTPPPIAIARQKKEWPIRLNESDANGLDAVRVPSSATRGSARRRASPGSGRRPGPTGRREGAAGVTASCR